MDAYRIQVLQLCMRLLCLYFILQTGMTVLAVNNAYHYHNPYTNNEVVEGVSIKTVKTDSAIECGLACATESGCVSFNYGKKDQTCELHSKRASDTGKAPRDDYRYFELPKDETPRSQTAKTCRDIQQNRPDAPSGQYWLDPDGGSPANAFLGYCDMDTDGGGWTLVWAYTFTDFTSFSRSDLTPWPSMPNSAYVTVPVSTSPPKYTTDFNALDFNLWKDIGSDFMVTSNVNHWISCSPGVGSLVAFKVGSINCHNVKNVSENCLGNAPSGIALYTWRPYFGLYGSIPPYDKNEYFYFFEASNHMPHHDPCSSTSDIPGVLSPIGVPHGNIFIR